MFNIKPIHIVIIMSFFYFGVFVLSPQPRKKAVTLLEIEEQNNNLQRVNKEFQERKKEKTQSPDHRNGVLSPLSKRAEDVQAKCRNSTVPSSPEMKNAIRATNVSQQLTHMFKDQHTKKISTRLFYLQKQKIVWCPLPKVASTSISKIILDLDQAPTFDDDYPQALLRQTYRMPTSLMQESKFAETESFVVVREPMERLVSAYKNKLVNISSNTDGVYFYNTYSKNIIAQYRQKGKDLEEDVTFPEFVDYLLHTDPFSYDDHWKPAYIFCSLCSLPFKYVLSYEKFNSEFSNLMNIVYGDLKNVLHANKSKQSEGGTGRHLDMLDAEKRKKLILIYSLDYYILGYDINKYM